MSSANNTTGERDRASLLWLINAGYSTEVRGATHDVFVHQVAGKKDWPIYDTKVTLPLKGQGCDPDEHQPGPVSEQVELGPGDVVYLPRGLMHLARVGR